MHRIILALSFSAVLDAAPLLQLPPSPAELVSIKKAAEAGDRVAQRRFGEELERTTRYAAAEHWYRAAARQGDPAALCDLGELYHQTRGFGTNAVKANYTNALALHRLAAAQGFKKSHFHLAHAYKTGSGVPKSTVIAYQHFKLSEPGPVQDQYLRELIPQMTQAEIEQAEKAAKAFRAISFQQAFEEAVFQSLHVEGTIHDSREKLAVINGQIMHAGDKINLSIGSLPAQIKCVEVKPRSVIFSFGPIQRAVSQVNSTKL